MDLALLLLAGAATLAFAAFLLTYKHSARLLAWLTGLTGGLIAVQVANVHVFTVVTFLWFLNVAKNRPGRWSPGIGIMLSVLLVAFTALLGDLVSNPGVALQVLTLAANAAMITAKCDADDRRRMLRGLLAAASIASALAILEVLGLVPAVLWHPDVSSVGRPTGFYPEPDWLGLFSGIGVVLAWRTLAPRAKSRYFLLAINVTALALAFARAAWVGLAASALLFLALSVFARKKARGGTLPAIVFVALLAAAGLYMAPSVRADLSERVQSIYSTNTTTDVSGHARVQQTEGLLRLASTAPWYGHGISASGSVGVSGKYDPTSGNSIGSNWILSLWVDAKFLAVPLMLLLVLTALRGARTVEGQVLVLLLVNNLFSNATFSPITWLALGLALAALRAADADTDETTEEPLDVRALLDVQRR